MNRLIFAFVATNLLALSVPAASTEQNWQAIDQTKSNVSFTGDNAFIKSREWQRRDHGTQERIKFAGGEIFYEELYYSGATWVSVDRKRYLRDTLAKGLNKDGQKYQAGEITKRDFSKFGFDYLTAQSSTTKCFLGLAAEDRDGRTWHMNISACRALSSKSIAKFEDDVFDILTRVRFDGGELNKTRVALESEPKKAESKPAPKKKQASESAPAPTPVLEPANYPKLGPVAAILDGSTIKDSLKAAVTTYQEKKGAKALVMSDNGEKLFWSNRKVGLESAAIESATTNCQTKTKLTCHVIAVNDDLALNLDSIKNKTFN